MRDLLNILEDALTESIGLANRKAGTKFTNPEGDELTFQSLDFFPERGKYPGLAELDAALKQAFDAYGIAPNDITWTNPFNKSMLAFGIVHFTDDQGQDYYFGRWFREISANRLDNNFPNNAIPGGYRMATGASKKETSDYKPGRALTQLQGNTPDSIYQQIVAKFGEDSAEAVATRTFMAATNFPVTFPKGNINFAAFRDYFCEMLQPMALVMGKPVLGNAQEAADLFVGGSFEDCTIDFGESEIGGLTDSILSNQVGQIKLSSKGKLGAKASAVNLLNSAMKIKDTPYGQKILKKGAEVIDILQTINQKGGTKKAPLDLAVQYKIISSEEAAMVNALQPLGTGDQVPDDMLTPNLRKLYNERNVKDASKVVPFWHLLAAIAFKVGDKINSTTNFSEIASSILNADALIQMYTNAKEGKDTITITGFKTVYPSTAVTGVFLDPGKTYYSTGSKGNFTFNIMYNDATPEDLEAQENVVDTKPDPDPETNLVDVGKRRSDIKASGLKQPEQDVSNLGRKRRKPI